MASECRPVSDLEALRAWSPPDYLQTSTQEQLRERSEPISAREALRLFQSEDLGALRSPESRVRTLHCHDMMGGYLTDKYVNGSQPEASRPYTFTHWAYIDTFVYFSHHFITIPPPGWVTAAHRNGVTILGTIITEWDNGAKLCSQECVLKSPESINWFVERCVAIAVAHGFDGYLLNIENPLEGEGQVPAMLKLAKMLTEGIKEAVGDHGQVIWYDSVTLEGKLSWQNCLNSLNRDFFDACDAIFLNYTWTPEKLDETVRSSRQRRGDVYVGVDVFGRGCPGGGGFNTMEALGLARERGLSVAIFAPGWTYEIAHRQFKEDNEFPLERAFLCREYAFWSLLSDALYVRGPKKTLTKSGCWTSQLVFESCFFAGCEETLLQHQPTTSVAQERNEPQSPRDLVSAAAAAQAEAEAAERHQQQQQQQLHQGEAAARSSSRNRARKKTWWLDLTRQEFQSSFFATAAWPKEKEEREKLFFCTASAASTTNTLAAALERVGSGNYCIIPTSQGLRIEAAVAGEQQDASTRVPILITQFASPDAPVSLEFSLDFSTPHCDKTSLYLVESTPQLRAVSLPLGQTGSVTHTLQPGHEVRAIGLDLDERQCCSYLKKLSIRAQSLPEA